MSQPIARWNKALWFALSSFIIATALTAVAEVTYQNERDETSGWVVPLPPPGQSVRLKFRPARNWRRYALRLQTSAAKSDSVDLPNRPAYPCDLSISIKRDGKLEREFSTRLHHTGEYEWASVALYGTDVIEFGPGDREITVSNRRCDPGYAFFGGVLEVERISPVMISRALLPMLGAMLFALLGLVSTVFGLFSLRRYRSELKMQATPKIEL